MEGLANADRTCDGIGWLPGSLANLVTDDAAQSRFQLVAGQVLAERLVDRGLVAAAGAFYPRPESG